MSCGTQQVAIQAYLTQENGLPVINLKDSEHVTYLMLSPFGSIEDYNGVSSKGAFSELFYENTVVLKADAGTLLPDASQVKSSVEGSTFRGWAYYDPNNDNVWPDYYEAVQETNGLALKAIFDGTKTSSEGGGGVTPITPTGEIVTYTVTGFPDWIPNDGSTVFAWSWGGDNGTGKWTAITLQYDGTDKNYSNVTGTFEAPNNITGFNMARCVAGTTTPNWTATGDSEGRIYNKTGDVTVSSGVTTYSSPNWVEYSYNP